MAKSNGYVVSRQHLDDSMEMLRTSERNGNHTKTAKDLRHIATLARALAKLAEDPREALTRDEYMRGA